MVRLVDQNELRFAKIVQPKRLPTILAAARAASEVGGRPFATPEPVNIDQTAGVVVWSALSGRSLYALLGSEDMIEAARAAGRALKALHQAPHTEANSYSAQNEVAMLQRWIERATTFAPERRDQLVAAALPVFRALLAGSSPPTLLHRDFYDKQVFVADDGSIGLLDFDTLACGEAALDLANALVHFDLRAQQGRCTAEQAEAAKAALIDGYQPEVATRQRIAVYDAAVRLRLLCVYTFRPQWRTTVAPLLDRGGVLIGT